MASNAQPPLSLRDLYVDPNQAWSFTPPKPSNVTVGPAGHQPQGPMPAQPIYQYTPRHSPTSVFSLSPSLAPSLSPPDTFLDYKEPEHLPLPHIFKSLVASFILQYTSTAIVMPWEVGKLLLQVQWVPRDTGEEVLDEDREGDKDSRDDADTDEEHECDADSYFADPLQSQSSVTLAASGSNLDSTSGHTIPANRPPAPRAIVDEHGHIVRRSVLEEGTRPEYIIPVGSASGVWGMMKRVGRYRTEGWFALWKGLLTSCITEILSDTFQPFINVFLQSLFFPTMSPFHRPPILLPVASHLLTGFILSPLDLIRTRLMVQSSNPKHRTYSGPIDAFQQILRDEGGLRGMYLHPHLLIPTILDNALRPIVALALPGMLTSYFGWGHITEDTHPIGWGVVELAGSCLGLLVTLPIETIRRRLQAQARGNAKPLKTCVEMRPKPYNGIVDAFWHILTEERSDLPIVRRRKKRNTGKDKEKEGGPEEEEYESWWKHTGLGQLYRGLGMRLGASAVVFVLALFGGGGDFGNGDGGWAEI